MTELPALPIAVMCHSEIRDVQQRPERILSRLSEAPKLNDSPTVFIVEDDEATRESIFALLHGRGLAARSFASCEAFLADLATIDRGCLLLDYHFDGLTGFGLLDALRTRGLSFPTILYTGRFDAGIRRKAGAYDEIVAFLQKPFGGQDLLDTIDKALGKP